MDVSLSLDPESLPGAAIGAGDGVGAAIGDGDGVGDGIERDRTVILVGDITIVLKA
jgi:hypothetical protein